MKAHDRVGLAAPIPSEGLEIGGMSPVVHVFLDGLPFEVESLTLESRTATMVTLDASAGMTT